MTSLSPSDKCHRNSLTDCEAVHPTVTESAVKNAEWICKFDDERGHRFAHDAFNYAFFRMTCENLYFIYSLHHQSCIGHIHHINQVGKSLKLPRVDSNQATSMISIRKAMEPATDPRGWGSFFDHHSPLHQIFHPNRNTTYTTDCLDSFDATSKMGEKRKTNCRGGLNLG